MINSNILNAHVKSKLLPLILLAAMVGLAGCAPDDDDGDDISTTALPTVDTTPFSFFCEDIGLFNETCVLDDPNNPYRFASVFEANKQELGADAPSATARFYLWATALARGAGAPGENQFFVALSLHQMYGASDSEPTRQQALRAYRSYLDNYFDSTTFFLVGEDESLEEESELEGDELADAIVESGLLIPISLNKLTGQMLFSPLAPGNTYTGVRLFSGDADTNKVEAAEEVSEEWGYYYDEDTGIFTKF